MQLSAYTVDSGRTVLCLAAFDSAASSRVVVLGGDGKELASLSVPGEVRSVSLYGGYRSSPGQWNDLRLFRR